MIEYITTFLEFLREQDDDYFDTITGDMSSLFSGAVISISDSVFLIADERISNGDLLTFVIEESEYKGYFVYETNLNFDQYVEIEKEYLMYNI